MRTPGLISPKFPVYPVRMSTHKMSYNMYILTKRGANAIGQLISWDLPSITIDFFLLFVFISSTNAGATTPHDFQQSSNALVRRA